MNGKEEQFYINSRLSPSALTIGQTEGLSKGYLFIHSPHRIMPRQTIASLTAELEELRPLANGKTEADLREQQQALFILLAAVATIGFIF